MCDCRMRERDGFLLVYSITDRSTFDALHSFHEQLSAMHEDNMPPIVLGLHMDTSAQLSLLLLHGDVLTYLPAYLCVCL